MPLLPYRAWRMQVSISENETYLAGSPARQADDRKGVLGLTGRHVATLAGLEPSQPNHTTADKNGRTVPTKDLPANLQGTPNGLIKLAG